MATSSLGLMDAKLDAKDEGHILYDLLYVCGGKSTARNALTGGCQRSNSDLNVSVHPEP
jgi:hypothetical protein